MNRTSYILINKNNGCRSALDKQYQIQRLMSINAMKILLLLVSCIAQFRPSHGTDLPADCKLNDDGKVLDCLHLDSFPNGSFADVEVVNFSDNNFTALTHGIFHKHGFGKLKTAILRYDQIDRIDFKAFIMMAEIEHLDLYGNKLKSLSRTSLIGLTALTSLCLGSNRLTSIEADVFRPAKVLDSLDLSNNSITHLPEDLLKYGFVTQLDISENPLVFSGHGFILKSSYLHQLHLRSCSLEKLPAEAFSQLSKLQSLDLSRNKLRVIPEGLLNPLKELQYLDISSNFIAQLEPQLFAFTKLRQINCAGNPGQTDMNCEDFLTTTTSAPCMKGFKSMSWNYTDNGQNTDNNASLEESKLSNHNVSHVDAKNAGSYIEDDGNSIVFLLYCILSVAIMCFIALAVLICQVCYFKFIMPRRNIHHKYEEILTNVELKS